MKHLLKSTICFAIVGGLLLSTGCGEDQKNRIAMLEQNNQQLLTELDSVRSELMAQRHANDNCQNELAMARGEASDLKTQLASAGKHHSNPAQPVEVKRTPSNTVVPSGWSGIPDGAFISVDGSVLFAPGSTKIRNEAKDQLKRIAGALARDLHGKHVLVIGHTDNTPIRKSSFEDNRQLSAERALEVTRYLISHGVAPERVIAGGAGEFRPLVPNTNAANLAKNRRVEIYAVDRDMITAPGR